MRAFSFSSVGPIATLVAAAALTGFAASATHAAPVTYTTTTAFDTAAAGIPAGLTIITFESETVGAKGQNYNFEAPYSGINTTIAASTNVNGGIYVDNGNGGKVLRVDSTTSAATMKFTFTPGVVGFGADFLGVQANAQGTVNFEFNDGTAYSYTVDTFLPQVGDANGFFGFLDAGKTINSVTLNMIGAQQDDYNLDNLRVVRADSLNAVQPVPEPGAVVTGLIMAGTTGLGMVRGRIRSRRK